MHLSEEVVCQSAIIIESTQVCAANVADLELLVAGWARGILEVLEVALISLLLVLRRADLVHFVKGHGN